MLPQWIIEKKRDGVILSEEEIRWFIKGYSENSIPDYQMSALAMAIYLKGMSFEEVTFLTDAMLCSGSTVDTSVLSAPTVDKHSTGGIGDKVSLILAPLVAACGVAVPMLSGRGLGITGGTLDKLESIPGYRTDLSIKEFLDIINQCGCSIMGQTSELAPADRKLYALRDVTGTVPSIPLISASIMSKKLAENTAGLVLDVKWGKGAFMKSIEDARELALTMIEIGRRMGRGMTALLTNMNQPLGQTAGNALEIIETIDALQGKGPKDLMEITIALSAEMLLLAGLAPDKESAESQLMSKLESGAAFNIFRHMVSLHGGDLSYIDNPETMPSAANTTDYPAACDGFVSVVDAEMIGRACLVLGSGRQTVDDKIDPGAGFSSIVKTGARINKGDPLLKIHYNNTKKAEEAMSFLDKAFTITSECPKQVELINETIKPGDIK